MKKLAALIVLASQVFYGLAWAQTRAKPLNIPRPTYTADLVRAGAVGTVKVKMLIAADGTTEPSLAQSSGFAALDDHVLNALRAWTFVAATNAEGEKIATEFRADFVFRLEDTWDRPKNTLGTLTCAEAKYRALAEQSTDVAQSSLSTSLQKDALALILASASSAESRGAIERSFSQAYALTMQACAATPAESFLKTLHVQLTRAGA